MSRQWKNECFNPSLLEENFLIALFEQKNREIYAKVIALDIDEQPIDQIEGKVSGGSINVDGDSAVRRSCSLTMVTDEIDINDYYWGLKTKFKLEIGLVNNLLNENKFQLNNPMRPEIVWFKSGTYLISSFNTSISTNNCSISLQGKDKMCMLNGDFGGQLFASVDFGTEEYQEKILTKANTEYTDSDALMRRNYYYKVEDINNLPEVIYQNDPLYVFLIDNTNLENFYWKNGNKYEKSNNRNFKGKHYQIYKMVTVPEELFDKVDTPAINEVNNFFELHKQKGLFNIKTTVVDNFVDVQDYFYAINDLATFQKVLQNKASIITKLQTKVEDYDELPVIENNINNTRDCLNDCKKQLLLAQQEQRQGLITNVEIANIEEQISNLKEQLNELKSQKRDYKGLDSLEHTLILKDLYQIDYNYTIKKIPLEKIIRESVHTYGKEPYHNIVISDLDDYGLEQLSYRGDEDLYAIRPLNTQHFTQLILSSRNKSLKDIVESDNFHPDTLTDAFVSNDGVTKVTYVNGNWERVDDGPNLYTVVVIQYGDDLGYRITDLTYTGDLISSIGESLTSILDKIKTMLGDFEYFYDVDGRFIFQRKKTYVNTSWSLLTKMNGEEYIQYANEANKYSFSFEGNILLTAISNNPSLNNLKNDFSVWGKRKGISGGDIPIHARYAIDKKPVRYQAFNGTIYVSDEADDIEEVAAAGIPVFEVKRVDWRELIYQMAYDYFQGQGCSVSSPLFDYMGNEVLNDPDLFLYEVGRRNPKHFPFGTTGYEQYYTDMEGFWRQLYNPYYQPKAVFTPGEYEGKIEKIENTGYYAKKQNWEEAILSDYEIEFYFNDYSSIEDYADSRYQDYQITNEAKQKYNQYNCAYQDNSEISTRVYWNINVFEAPETLNFWIEFLDSDSELAQFSVPVVGDRSKTVNEDKASAIVFREVPDLILVDREEDIERIEAKDIRSIVSSKTGYTFIYLPRGFSQYLTISYRSISVKDKIDQLLYQFGYCIESVSITALPIYNLQPNTRIYVYDKTTKINGEYIVSKLTIPLAFNGTMSITAVKAPERLY